MNSDRGDAGVMAESPVFVGVDVGGSKIRVMASTSLQGEAEADFEVSTQRESVVSQIRDLVGSHLAGREGRVAIGVPGIVDPMTQHVSNLPYAGGLAGTALRDSFESAFGQRPYIENDVNLAAFGIYRELKEPIETLLVVAGGTGLGMGMMIHGRLVRGVRGGAGEIGDLRFGDASFEHELNARTLVTDDVAAGVPPEAVKQSLVRAAAGDAVAGRLVDNYSDALLALLTILETTFDPNRIELTGGVASSPAVVEAIKDRIGGSSLNSIVKWAERGPAAPAWGALEYARWGRPPEEDVGASVEHSGARR